MIKYIKLNNNPKILLFSDTHFHEYKPFSVPTEEGIGSRFNWLLDAFNCLCTYAIENQIEHLFFLGDLFHQRTLMYSIVYEKVAEIIENAIENGIQLHLILGNHDYIYNNDNSPSVVKRIRGIDVIDKPCVYYIYNIDEKIACLPFRFNIENLITEIQLVNNAIKEETKRVKQALPHLILGHFELEGVAVNNEYILSRGLNQTVFDDTVFKYIFSGHVHKAQVITRKDKKVITFVGHMLPHTFGDENNIYGFIVYDFSKSNYEFINLKSLKQFPEFVTVDIQNQEDIKKFIRDKRERFNIDYYRIRTYSDDLQLENVFKRLSHYTSEYIGPVINEGANFNSKEESVQFNLDIKYYLNLFLEQEKKSQNIEWLNQQDLLAKLDTVLNKGNICLS
jgi:DNA repair exonuclease SbcCD nuclease subunit